MLSVTLISPNLSPFQSHPLFEFHHPKPSNHLKKTNTSKFYPFQETAKCCCSTFSSTFQENPVGNSANFDGIKLAEMVQGCLSVREVKRVHSVAAKWGNGSGIFVLNNLVWAYVRMGRLDYAREVFDKMPERNVVSWTAMLGGYLRFGLEDEALRFYLDLVKSGVVGNSKTFVCVLDLCSRRLDLELGRQIHACLVKGDFGNLIVESAVVHFYAQCGCLEDAFRAFERMKERDVICWTTIITACSQHGRGEDAIGMFSRMLSDGFDPNEFTICSVLKACGEENMLKFGQQLHGCVVKKMFRSDVYLETSLVDMYAKCGKIGASKAVFDEMRRRNMVTWTSIIAGYARNGLGEEAINLFRVMKKRKIYANNLTMVSILRACGLTKALMIGKEVHAQVLKNNIQNNVYLGSTLVWLYCKCGEYNSAFNVLEGLGSRDVVSWTAMISGCNRIGHEYEALEFMKIMLGEGVEPNPFTYSSALKSCAQLENVWQGKSIHSSISKNPASSNVFVGSSLISMYAKCGNVSDAIDVFNSMPEKNLVSLKAMILGYAKNGLCGEAMKLLHRMQAEGLEVDDYILATVLTTCGDLESSQEHSAGYCLRSN